MTARFLIAKYVPDVFRDEPRNVGVIVWLPDAIAGKFFGDEGPLPDFVDSSSACQQWISYWKKTISNPEISTIRNDRAASATSPDFLEILKSHNCDHFKIVDAGNTLDDVPKEEINSCVNFIFDRLVAIPVSV